MTTARQIYEQQPHLTVAPPQKEWPTMYDLPSEDPEEPGLPDEFHSLQPQLLSATLRLADVVQDKIFTGTDINLYYDLKHPQWYKRPDWFAVAGVNRRYDGHDLRLSYVTWDEQVIPFVVVELISPGTAMSDLGEVKREQNGTPTKWQVYEQILKVPHYVVFDRYKDKLWCFKLIDGKYQAQNLSDGRYFLTDMGLGIGVWTGEYQGFTRPWLRWYDEKGDWILTPTEVETRRAEAEAQRAAAEAQRAEAEAQRAETEAQRANRLAERLRELGVDPDEI